MAANLRWRRWVWAGVAVCAAVGGGLWLWWPNPTPPPRARQYVDHSVCLLADAGGVASGPAAAAWAGMQDASAATAVRVQFLAVPGEQSEANAAPYLASLAVRRCALIVAVGDAPVAAVRADASKYPTVQFATIGGSTASNVVTVIDSASDVRSRVKAVTIGSTPTATPRR